MGIKEFNKALSDKKDVIARMGKFTVLFHGSDNPACVTVRFYLESTVNALLNELNEGGAEWEVVNRLTKRDMESTDL